MKHNQMVSRNRLANTKNGYQGHFKRVLCVCSAGALRSPTLAWILSNDPFNFNTRAVGTEEYAIVPIDLAVVAWADEIVTFQQYQYDLVQTMLTQLRGDEYSRGFNLFGNAKLHLWNVPDQYGYRDPQLIEILSEKAYETFAGEEGSANTDDSKVDR